MTIPPNALALEQNACSDIPWKYIQRNKRFCLRRICHCTRRVPLGANWNPGARERLGSCAAAVTC